jgi:predicted NBD/HSP70 family sugar kinase
MTTKNSPLRAADVRKRNENIVLRLIYSARKAGLSQSEVVAATGLKPPTIFRIFSSLEAAGYIEPLQQPASQPPDREKQEKKGRRPLAYLTKADALYLVGVEFWVEQISLGVFDFQGKPIFTRTIPLVRSENASDVVDLIVKHLQAVIRSLNIPAKKVLGIGVGAPGQVNVGGRIVTSYPRIPGMRDFPIANLLEERLGFPVFLHNNCSIIALSEFRYGRLGMGDSMFMFLLRSGINGAFVDGGKIFLSPRGTTIEMGHISIDYDGPPCICGAKGCLEAFMSSLDREGHDERRWLFENLEGIGAEGAATLDTAASYLASAVQTASRLFRPSSFLFVTHSGEIAEQLARRVGEKVLRNASIFDDAAPRFFGCAYDPELAQRGAADLVVDAFLN